MKVAAHPLVVAVALGLLGPNALAEDDDSRRSASRAARPAPCDGCTCGALDGDLVAGDCDDASDPMDAAVEAVWRKLVDA
jgi:hypothetical protein